MNDINKYGTDNLIYHKSVLDISPRDFYAHLVNEAALNFLSSNEEEILIMVGDDDDFDSYSSGIEESFNETVRDISLSDNRARLILDYTSNESTDEGLWENSEDPEQVKAAYSFADDVSEQCTSTFDDLKEKFQEILYDIDEAIKDIHNGSIEADPEDINHIVGVNALALWCDIEGNFEQKVAQIKEFEEINVLAESIDFSKTYALNLAFREIVEDPARNIYPEPVVPGSIQEAAVIVAYLEAASSSYAGGYPLGGAYIDDRSNGDEKDYIFAEYQDSLASALLRPYVSPSDDVRYVNEARALLASYNENNEVRDPTGGAYIERHSLKHDVAPKIDFKDVMRNLESIVDGSIGRKAGLVDYVSVSKNRDLSHSSKSDLKKYLALFHPEAARVQLVSERYSKQEMDFLVAGIMDGSEKSKDRLMKLKESIDEQVSPATPALKAFRKKMSNDLSVKEPSPDSPSI